MRAKVFVSHSILLICLGALTTACGNGMYDRSGFPLNPYSSGSLSDAVGFDGSFTQGDYKCPASPNVLPSDQNVEGNASYTVCQNSQNQANILIHGQLSGSTTICAFPAQVVDSSHIYAKPDLSTGMPWSACTDFSQASTGVYAQFPGVTYNAVFIVAGADHDAMQRCLYLGDPLLCPTYSFGKFR